MADPDYADKGHVFDRAREECAELIKAICKAERFGLDAYHPTRPEKGDNVQQIMHEIEDVQRLCVELHQWLAVYKVNRART